jgi:hypothetical protein
MSWGINWGGGFWGGGDEDLLLAGFSIASAIATSSRTFSVTFTKAPQFQSTLLPNDAANLTNWQLVRTDTGASIVLMTARATLDPLTLEFVILGTFVSQFVTYLVQAKNLVAVDHAALVDPKFGTFLGMPASRALARQQQPLQDVWNPQVEGDQINGGLVVGSAGDYLNETGAELLKKLIIRRITTAQNSFRHLFDRDYGAGIQPNELFTQTDLIGLKTLIERQVKLEPEVRSVRVKLTSYPDNRLVVDLLVQVKSTNQQIFFSVPLTNTNQLAA